jgi:hypothetical protein
MHPNFFSSEGVKTSCVRSLGINAFHVLTEEPSDIENIEVSEENLDHREHHF